MKEISNTESDESLYHKKYENCTELVDKEVIKNNIIDRVNNMQNLTDLKCLLKISQKFLEERDL